jgi:isoleucyl-tRNA synthetase
VYCRYEPLFDYFMEFSDSAFRVIADNYVTDDSGTGIVHCAPAFGEDDYRVCSENQVINKVFLFDAFKCSKLCFFFFF